MTHKIVHTDNYLLIMDTSKTDPLDSSKIGDPIAHLPLNGSPILEGVDLLPPYSRHQEDGVEELAKLKYPVIMRPNGRTLAGGHYDVDVNYSERSAYKYGYNKAREKYKYTEEDMREAISHAYKQARPDTEYEPFPLFHQYPTEFECEMIPCNPIKYTTEDHLDVEPKTITTAQGRQWVGKYK